MVRDVDWFQVDGQQSTRTGKVGQNCSVRVRRGHWVHVLDHCSRQGWGERWSRSDAIGCISGTEEKVQFSTTFGTHLQHLRLSLQSELVLHLPRTARYQSHLRQDGQLRWQKQRETYFYLTLPIITMITYLSFTFDCSTRPK